MKVAVVYYSLYGHVKALADAVARGASEVDGAKVTVYRVAETLPAEVIAALGATDAQKQFASIPVPTPAALAESDAIIFGGLWMQGALVGKVGAAFTSSATQHGGNEETLFSLHRFMLHHGMIIAGLPYSFAGQMRIDEVTGGSPYGVSTITGGKGERMPSQNELDSAIFLGKRVATIAEKLAQ
jgi:NAD(P)H dehydrogenase (quinone)